MEIKICKGLDECGKLWQKFSSNEILFDVWDFRMCFYNENDDSPYFIMGYEKEEPMGLIPLSFDKNKSKYSYFGGWFPERNKFFLKDKTKLAQLLEQCPDKTFIEGIEPSEGKHYDFVDDEYTYFLDLSKYDNDFEKYFSSFDKKKQKKFNRDMKNIPKYKIYSNRLKDFDRLVELNIRQYEEDSKFNDKTILNGINKMMNIASEKGILDMVSVEINDKIEAVDIGIVFGNRYNALIGGSNNQKIPNLGKLMTILNIKNAISKKTRFVDFFATSGHWKEMWKFDKEMLLKFVK